MNHPIYYLTVTDYGLCGGIHLYGRLRCPDGEEIQVKHLISSKEAAEFNKIDGLVGYGGGYKAGDVSFRFCDRDDLYESTVDTARTCAQGAEFVLFKGAHYEMGPHQVLYGPEAIRPGLESAWESWKAVGGWNCPSRAKRLEDQWTTLLDDYFGGVRREGRRA